jgi:hypothetical protein
MVAWAHGAAAIICVIRSEECPASCLRTPTQSPQPERCGRRRLATPGALGCPDGPRLRSKRLRSKRLRDEEPVSNVLGGPQRVDVVAPLKRLAVGTGYEDGGQPPKGGTGWVIGLALGCGPCRRAPAPCARAVSMPWQPRPAGGSPGWAAAGPAPTVIATSSPSTTQVHTLPRMPAPPFPRLAPIHARSRILQPVLGTVPRSRPSGLRIQSHYPQNVCWVSRGVRLPR